MKDISFDTIIVGGGILGSTLFNALTTKLKYKVCLIEKSGIGSGTTAQSPGFISLLHHGWHLKAARFAFEHYQALPLKVTELKRFAIKTLEGKKCTDVPAIRIEARKTCEFLAMHAALQGGQMLCNTHYLRHKKDANGLLEVATSKGIIWARKIICCTGINYCTWDTNGNNSSLIAKSFQYSIYNNSIALEYAIIDKLNRFYLLPDNNSQLIGGFFDQDQVIDAAGAQACAGLHQRLHQLISTRFPRLSNQFKSSELAYDTFTLKEKGVFIEVDKGVVLGGGMSGNGITQSPLLVKEFLQSTHHHIDCTEHLKRPVS